MENNYYGETQEHILVMILLVLVYLDFGKITNGVPTCFLV
jgi:hypothetical protein